METEVKIPLSDRSAIEQCLTSFGFHISVPRRFESNDLYDTADHSLRRQSMLLRLRRVADKSVVTWKGPGVAGPHKSRPELETTLGSADTLAEILKQLGYQRTFRYEKYRTEYQKGQQHSVVTLDETPIGDFMEIEGEPGWIDATAGQLGFSQDDYILESYGSLYLEHCKKLGMQPGDMVFASH
ncbi:MAG TPA: class IV adenylate cyclase [Bryobacteraceae bacterium]|jgi:adenylate cyclase class 2